MLIYYSQNRNYNAMNMLFWVHACMFREFVHIFYIIGAPDDPAGDENLKLASGDFVRVELDVDVLRIMQEDHGGWIEDMKLVSQNLI